MPVGPTHTHTRRQAPAGAGASGAPWLGSSCPAGTQLGTHELQVKVSSAVLRTISQAETSDTRPTRGPHMLPGGGLQHSTPNPCDSFPPVKDRKVSLPR